MEPGVEKPRMMEHSDRADVNISTTSEETCDLIVSAAQQAISDQNIAIKDSE
jgi:3-oxoacyl-[acyl-carrier-protein] synthase III